MKKQLFFLLVIVILGFFLRFVDVSNDPPGLYTDEASIGYNAYTILTTGKDEFGIPHPLWFRSYGDYKMPFYIYAVASSMAVFGKTEFAIRFPSVIAGTLTIIVLYLFIKKLLELEIDKKLKERLKYLPLLASFLLVISTWHLQFSRGGFEVTVGTLFYLLGWYLYFLFKQKHTVLRIVLSVIFFLFAVYTYDTFRILSIVALLFIAIERKVYKYKKAYILVGLTSLLILPIILFSFTLQGHERFFATSAFSQLKVTNIFLQMLFYPLTYINNYLSFFSFDFLFSFGDGIGRHQVQDFGELYRWQLPFFISGIYFLLQTKKSVIKYATFLLLLTTPLAGAVAQPSPHALRSLPLVIPYMIFISIGILLLLQRIKKYKYKLALIILIGIFACFEFVFYLQFYYVNYPQDNIPDWGGGYKQLVLATAKVKNNYKHIVIDTSLQYAPTYFHFYDSSIPFTMVPPSWTEPKSWRKDSVLYIRPYFGHINQKGLVENVYLPKIYPEVFAQLLSIKQ
jgi:hypothetical protein